MTVGSQSKTAMNDHQGEVIALLSRPETYDSAVDHVQRIDTHISHIFLAGPFAYKLKRAVIFPYLDFSSVSKRRQTCWTELCINRRTAPDMYLDVIPITREGDGSLRLSGTGRPVDWLVKMVRFDDDFLFSRMAERDALSEPLMEQLAKTIANFHTACAKISDHFGPNRTRSVLDVNLSSFLSHSGKIIAEAQARQLTNQSLSLLNHLSGLLEKRETEGQLRHCHGDLHLANICLFQGKPTLFDALEFNKAFAEIDVFYDLAFLLMDLDHCQRRSLANIVLNRYLDITGDVEGLALLPLFLSMRAAVRSHVSLAQISKQYEIDPDLVSNAKTFFQMATDYLSQPPPNMIVIGGLSGTGKSSLARAIAPQIGAAPGARVVRTDAIRKRLFGSDLQDRLPQQGYTPDMTSKTYDTVYKEARIALASGHSVICDGVFAHSDERQNIEAIAQELAVPFFGIWLYAPEDVLVQRVNDRVNDISDATETVVRQQLSYDTGPINWSRIDASGKLDQMSSQALEMIAT